MNMKKLLLILIIYFITLSHAYAYLDPGTGSIIMQALVAALAAGAATISYYWRKVKAFVFRNISKKKNK
jgi:uncharacterized membrane protein